MYLQLDLWKCVPRVIVGIWRIHHGSQRQPSLPRLDRINDINKRSPYLVSFGSFILFTTVCKIGRTFWKTNHIQFKKIDILVSILRSVIYNFLDYRVMKKFQKLKNLVPLLQFSLILNIKKNQNEISVYNNKNIQYYIHTQKNK